MKKISYSKTRMFVLSSEYVYTISSYIIFVERFRLKQKKSGLIENKTCKFKNHIFNVFKCNKIIVSGAIDRTAVTMIRFQLITLVSQRKQHTYTAKILTNV
jgi:hypothetical protein